MTSIDLILLHLWSKFLLYFSFFILYNRETKIEYFCSVWNKLNVVWIETNSSLHEYGHPSLKYRSTFKLNFAKNVLLFQKNTSSESANAEGRMAAPIYSKVSRRIHSAASPMLFSGIQLPSDHLHVCNRHLSVLSALFNNLLLRGLFRPIRLSIALLFTVTFQLDTSHVFFMERWHSAAVPLVFSALLLLVYMGTKRSAEIEKQRQMLVEKEKQARSVCNSTINSRKTSRVSSRMQSRRESISLHDDTTRVESKAILL